MEESLGFVAVFSYLFNDDRLELLEDRPDVVVDWLPYVALVLAALSLYDFLRLVIHQSPQVMAAYIAELV